MFATKDQDNRRAGARGLTRNRHGAVARRLRRAAAGAVCAAAVAFPLISAAGAQAATAMPIVTFTNLALLNGWGTYPGSASPAVTDISGIVHFKGAISTNSGNTNLVAFVLPPGFRPAKNVTIPVNMCDANSGELAIAPTGVTQVISQGATSTATCFTSLDGASFALSSSSFTTLKLQPGWTEFDNLYHKGAVRVINGIVHFEGEIKTAGTNPAAFTLPAGFRPSQNVYVPITLCTGSIGRLNIAPSGAVTVTPEGTGNWWMVKCGVSLDGASFALSPTSFTALTLQNGWMNAPYGTANAAVRKISGIVHLKGAIWSNGTSPYPFVLPPGFRPANQIWVSVDLCDGNNGRLNIQPDGLVTVQQQGGDPFSNATCFTSLDGASFAV
jgi:hypothetical protein